MKKYYHVFKKVFKYLIKKCSYVYENIKDYQIFNVCVKMYIVYWEKLDMCKNEKRKENKK